MKPALITDPQIANILKELVRREPIFHRSEFGTTRADFERMTEPMFWEVGASGRRYSRDCVSDELEKRYATQAQDDWQTRDFHCLEIAMHNYLLTALPHKSDYGSLYEADAVSAPKVVSKGQHSKHKAAR